MRRLNQVGDTIVEVLIVIVVIAMVMGSSYAVAIRSQKSNQQSQEHSQALRVAEGQLEQLKAYVGEKGDSGLAKFCFEDNGTLVNTGFGAAVPAATAGADNFAGYPAGCKKGIVANTACTSLCFNVVVVKGSNDLYTVTTRWDGVNRRDEVKLVYRLHP